VGSQPANSSEAIKAASSGELAQPASENPAFEQALAPLETDEILIGQRPHVAAGLKSVLKAVEVTV